MSTNLNTALDSAFDSAFSESAPQSTETETKPSTETQATESATTEEEPGAAPAAATQQTQDEDLDLAVTREELEAIKKDPVLGKLYKNFQKGATQKFQDIARQRDIIESYNADPEGFARRLAQYHGIQLAPPPPPTPSGEAVDDVLQEMSSLFGPEAAKALKPLFEKLAQNVVRGEVLPLRQQQEQMRLLGAAKQAETVTGAFRTKHADVTPEIESKMVELGQRFQPAEDVAPDEYLENLYVLATAGRVKAETSKEVVERMKKAAETVEPRKSVPANTVSQGSKVKRSMGFDEAFDTAWKEAAEGR